MARIVDDGMRSYYEQRAPEYDDWWLGAGRFTEIDRPGGHEEVEQLVGVVRALPPARVLDVACGTGFLTRHLLGEVTGLDQSPSMLEITASRGAGIATVQGDAVPLPFADGAFDRVFTGHFYGHLLPDERTAFLAEARRVAGELVVVDSAPRGDEPVEQWQERVLNDGSRHRVYKRFFTGPGRAAELGGGRVLYDGRWFVAVST
jgi:demethylmenaquinone methyltransferase/2-methoxy-6-polyprenyl-1,4-benzoquinol methylase